MSVRTPICLALLLLSSLPLSSLLPSAAAAQEAPGATSEAKEREGQMQPGPAPATEPTEPTAPEANEGTAATAGGESAAAPASPSPLSNEDESASRPTDVALDEADNERAKAHFEVGRSLYDSGRFKEAAEEWEAAYALSQRSELLYNIYVAYRDASDLPKAVDALRRYLATGDVDARQRINLEARLRAMEQAQKEADREAAGAAPETTRALEPAEQKTPAAPRQESVIEVGTHDAEGPNALPYAVAGVGAAMVIAGTVTGFITQGKVSDLEADCPDDVCPADYPLEDRRSSAETLANVTDVLLIGGVVIGGLGVALIVIDDNESADQPSASIGCGLGSCYGRMRF